MRQRETALPWISSLDPGPLSAAVSLILMTARASMRPRFMNRGSRTKKSGGALVRVPSMRPRFMNRGSVLLDVPFALQIQPSMRPRFMNRGSARARSASTPGTPASMRPRFMNRGSRERIAGGRGMTAASMRPRFMNRGSGSSHVRISIVCICFNEAPIHESGKLTMDAVFGKDNFRLQ